MGDSDSSSSSSSSSSSDAKKKKKKKKAKKDSSLLAGAGSKKDAEKARKKAEKMGKEKKVGATSAFGHSLEDQEDLDAKKVAKARKKLLKERKQEVGNDFDGKYNGLKANDVTITAEDYEAYLWKSRASTIRCATCS